jgi:predicted RNA-binding Zn ribbon-like protein
MSNASFLFLEGNPAWLDFVNTRYVSGDAPVDAMETYDDLLAWLRKAGLLVSGDADSAARGWKDSTQSREAIKVARDLRSELHAAAVQVAKNGSFPASALRLLNSLLESAPGIHRLVPTESGFRMDYEAAPKKAVHLLEPLVRSAADFLSRADLGRVRKCDNGKCVLYFYDSTRNGRRRWCAMAWCGNRNKAAAHYQRSKEQEGS